MMRTLRRFLMRLVGSVTRVRDENRLREELETHLALQTAENIRAGLQPVEARRQAALKLGGLEGLKEQYRHEQQLPLLENVFQDVRYTVRQLIKAPLFTLAATLSLALGIGASAAVFTVTERVLLRRLPVSHPEELVLLTDQRSREEQSPRFSYPFYATLRENSVLNGTAGRFGLAMNATMNGQLLRVAGELVSGNYFGVVGAATQIGRSITPQDDRVPGAHAVAVISDGLWRRSFASDPAVLGRGLHINGHAFTIVGVAATGFTGTDVGHPTDIWLPMMMQRELGRDLLTEARTNWLEIIGRLNPGVSRERAGEELTAYLDSRAPDVDQQFPRRRLLLLPGDRGNSPVRREIGPALRVLVALAALALALACVNVASLLAVRSAARAREIAVRVALGARRSRLTQQFLTETLMLAAIGGTAGLVMAPWAARLLIASQPYPVGIDASVDLRVFLFGLGVSVITGVLVGQAPIFAAREVRLSPAGGSASATSPGTSRRVTTHDITVALQIATSLAMLISAALLVQSLKSIRSVDPGFRADNLLVMSVDPGSAGYEGQRLERFWRDALERVSRIPGVESVSLAGTVPLSPGRQRQPWFNPVSGELMEIDTNFVGPAYFRTLGVPLLGGREFDERDGEPSRRVVIVNERLARMFWPEQDPIGKGLRIAGSQTGSLPEVIGVVKDVKYRDVRADYGPMVYRPLFQTSSTDPMTLHVRVAADPGALAATIRRELQQMDGNLPAFGSTTLEDQLNASFGQTRQAAALSGLFGVLAMLMSGIGVYGVTALAVSRRTREIGIRIALGARPGHIVHVIGRRALTLVLAGLSLGVLASLAFTRMAEALLYGVTAGDTATFAATSALVAIVSLIAFYVPLRVATRLDAAAAIRCD